VHIKDAGSMLLIQSNHGITVERVVKVILSSSLFRLPLPIVTVSFAYPPTFCYLNLVNFIFKRFLFYDCGGAYYPLFLLDRISLLIH